MVGVGMMWLRRSLIATGRAAVMFALVRRTSDSLGTPKTAPDGEALVAPLASNSSCASLHRAKSNLPNVLERGD